MGSSNDIDSLKFSIVLDSKQFEKEMTRVEGLADKFEKSVAKSLAITNLLDAAQGKEAKAAAKKVEREKEVVLLTRQELEARKAAGTITEKELRQLKSLIAADKALLDEENKKAAVAKKSLDIQAKQERLARRRAAAENKVGENVEKNSARLSRQSSIMNSLNTYVAQYASIFGAAALVRNLVRITGEFEAQHVALRAILQDASAADRIFYQLQELAVKSPFTFRNLTDYAKQLSAFSVPIDEIYDTTKRLADVSAGLGVDMSRIILAYGQIRSASFLRGQEVRQLTEAGIPVLEELAKQFKEIEGEAISVGKVFDKISARQVPFEMIEKMFKDLTSEGGKFYQMQEILAETVKGKVSNLQDAWEIMLSKVGEDNDVFIKGVLNGVTNLIKNYKDLTRVIGSAAVAWGSYRLVVNSVTKAEAMQSLVMTATGKKLSVLPSLLLSVSRGFKRLGIVFGNAITKLNPWAVAISATATALMALIMRTRRLNEHIRETDKITSKAIADAEATKSNIHYYIQRLKEAKEGTKEYNDAREAIINNSGAYISATDAERLSLQNVDEVWVNICRHIEEATKLQTMQSVTAEAAATRQEKQLEIMDALAKYQTKNKLSNEVRQNVAAHIRGEITKEELQSRLEAAGLPHSGTYSYGGKEYQLSNMPGTLEDLMDWALSWQLAYNNAAKIYDETIKRGKQNMDDLYGTGEKPEPAEPEPLKGWRKRVEDYLESVTDGRRGVKIGNETNLADFAEGGAKALDELRKSLEIIPEQEKDDYNKVKKDIAFWEQLSEVIYGRGKTEFGNTTKKTKKELKSVKDLQKEQVETIRESFQHLQRLKKAYDRLKGLGFTEGSINNLLVNFFGTGVPSGGFGTAFESLASAVEKNDAGLARDIRDFASGKDLDTFVTSVDAAQKATKKFNDSLLDLENTTKRLGFTGFAADIDKILVDSDSKNRQLRETWAQKLSDFASGKDGWIAQYRVEHPDADAKTANDAWVKLYDERKKAVDALIKSQVDYNNKVAQRKVDKQADAWVSSMLEENNINLNDLSDKTAEQIETLRDRLVSLKDTLPNLIPEGLKKDAQEVNVVFDNLLALIEKILDIKIKDLDTEKDAKKVERLAKSLKTLGSYLGNIGSSLSKFGGSWEGVGEALSSAGSSISSMSDIYEKMSSGEISKGSAQASLIMVAIDNIASATSRAIQNFEDMKVAMEEWALAVKASDYTLQSLYLSRFGYQQANVFGVEDPYSKALASSKQLREAQSLLLDQVKELSSIQVKVGQKRAIDAGDSVATIAEMTAAGAAIGAVAGGGVFSWATTAIGAAIGAVVGGLTSIFTSKKMVDVFSSLGELTGGKIFDPETLELTDEVLARYEQMDEAGKALIDHWKEIKETMSEALDVFNENVEAVIGDIGDSIKEMLVDAFNNGDVYDAIDDVHDYIGKAIQDLMSEIAFSQTIGPLFDELQTKMRHSFGLDENGNPMEALDKGVDYSWEDDLAWFDSKLGDALAGYNAAMDARQAALEALGYTWDTGEDSSSSNLGSGIKSITEDTANLLASYINAIRADVSYGKMQRERIAVALEGQGERYITLNDYLAKVQADTANIAESNRLILARFDAFMRDYTLPSASGDSIKVQIVN